MGVYGSFIYHKALIDLIMNSFSDRSGSFEHELTWIAYDAIRKVCGMG